MSLTYPRDDQLLADIWDAYRRTPGGRWRFALRHPWLSAASAIHRLRLPTLAVWPSRTGDGRYLAEVLRRRDGVRKPFVRRCASVLAIGPDATSYTQSRRHATLRRKLKAAAARGIAAHEVILPAERRELLRVAEAFDRHDNRRPNAAVDHADMLSMSVWLVVCDAAHDPKALAVIADDAPWAALRYFRPLGQDEVHALARWTLAEAMVSTLASRGVRYLLDDAHPGAVPSAVHAFQRMIGFRYARLRPSPPPAIAIRRQNRRQFTILGTACGGLTAAILAVPASASYHPTALDAARPLPIAGSPAGVPLGHQAALEGLGIAPDSALLAARRPGAADPITDDPHSPGDAPDGRKPTGAGQDPPEEPTTPQPREPGTPTSPRVPAPELNVPPPSQPSVPSLPQPTVPPLPVPTEVPDLPLSVPPAPPAAERQPSPLDAIRSAVPEVPDTGDVLDGLQPR